jgi:hypothetical protein
MTVRQNGQPLTVGGDEPSGSVLRAPAIVDRVGGRGLPNAQHLEYLRLRDQYSPKYILLNEILDLINLVRIAKENYESLPDGENSASVTNLLGTLRGLIAQLDVMEQNGSKGDVDELEKFVLRTFVTTIITKQAEELGALARSLIHHFGPQHAATINRLVQGTMRNLGPHYTQSYKTAFSALCSALGATADESAFYGKLIEAGRTVDGLYAASPPLLLTAGTPTVTATVTPTEPVQAPPQAPPAVEDQDD